MALVHWSTQNFCCTILHYNRRNLSTTCIVSGPNRFDYLNIDLRKGNERMGETERERKKEIERERGERERERERGRERERERERGGDTQV